MLLSRTNVASISYIPFYLFVLSTTQSRHYCRRSVTGTGVRYPTSCSAMRTICIEVQAAVTAKKGITVDAQLQVLVTRRSAMRTICVEVQAAVSAEKAALAPPRCAHPGHPLFLPRVGGVSRGCDQLLRRLSRKTSALACQTSFFWICVFRRPSPRPRKQPQRLNSALRTVNKGPWTRVVSQRNKKKSTMPKS